jgi:hypothetical protein
MDGMGRDGFCLVGLIERSGGRQQWVIGIASASGFCLLAFCLGLSLECRMCCVFIINGGKGRESGMDGLWALGCVCFFTTAQLKAMIMVMMRDKRDMLLFP